MTKSLHRSFSMEASAPIIYSHLFVSALPDKLEDGILYVCIRYATAAHNCFCGCGREVVTPIHPTKWQLIFDGVHVSLFPSIGSWSLPCQSHYWVRDGQIEWAEGWSRERIDSARACDLAAQEAYWSDASNQTPTVNGRSSPHETWWQRLLHWMGKK